MNTKTLCAGALLVTLTGIAGVRADTAVLNAGYETGTADSGITGLEATSATAPDAALASTAYARSGAYSIYHRVTLDNPAYVADGSPRSESSTLALIGTRYSPGTHGVYTFSLLLKDWQDWSTGQTIPIDIVWQFKHTSGGADVFVGVKRNQLVLRYGVGGGQLVLVNDIRPLDNKWIDLKFDILWSDTSDGYIKAWVGADGAALAQVADIENYATFSNGTGDFGYLKWGLYRPDSSSATGSVVTREVCHDNITASVAPPQLRIFRVDADLVLAWPYPSTGFLLENSPDLLPSTWTVVTTQPVIVGSEYQVRFGPPSARRFFRLHRL